MHFKNSCIKITFTEPSIQTNILLTLCSFRQIPTQRNTCLLFSQNTLSQSNSGRKGFMSSYNAQVTLHHWGKSGWKSEAGSEAEATEYCLLACSLYQSAIYTTQYQQPSSGLGPPTSTINRENATQTCPQVHLMEALTPWRVFPNDSSLCQLTSNWPQHRACTCLCFLSQSQTLLHPVS